MTRQTCFALTRTSNRLFNYPAVPALLKDALPVGDRAQRGIDQSFVNSNDMIGKTILHYKILEKLGEGGMGVVYLAEDTNLERNVAIKFLPGHVAANDEFRQRFKIEAKAAAALNHPNIATIYAIEKLDENEFIAMEYIDGQELIAEVETGKLTLEQIVNIAIQIADGLQAAHDKNIIHRDIKSNNIMLTGKGGVKIMDFGLAKVRGHSHITEAGSTLGTLAYMSPEQRSGEIVDHRTDLWSLGVVLYEMLTQARPFQGEFPAAIMYSILNQEPAGLSGFDEDHSQRLQSIIDRALCKDLQQRYGSAAELRLDLELLTKTGIHSVTDSSAQVARDMQKTLPNQLTSFIGREKELEDGRQLLRTNRLLTLTGPGGTGKTRLSMRIAEDLMTVFADGVMLVELASISDPELVGRTIASSFGIFENPLNPVIENLKHYLANRHLLLLLDNFEQVISAATLISDLLADCPQLHILVTSREPLHLAGEQEYPVPPLQIPESENIANSDELLNWEAVALFVQRAKSVDPKFALTDRNASDIAQICIKLDGLPLAIELAAARIRLFPPHAILTRLGDRLGLLKSSSREKDVRHRTLKEAIAWSYDLLNPEEQNLFRCLSVFVGGCSLVAAEHVCFGPVKEHLDILDGIEALLDKNLLRRDEQPDGEPRIFMLETIREYGLHCLKQAEELPSLQRTHCLYYLEQCELIEKDLTGPNQNQYLNILELEQDNLRAALTWAEENTEIELGLRICSAIWRFWVVRSHMREGRRWLERFVKMAATGQPTEERVRALNALGTILHLVSEHQAAVNILEECISVCRATNNKPVLALTLNNCTYVFSILGDNDAVDSFSREALELNRELGEKRGISVALSNLGFYVGHNLGDYPRARSYYYEAFEIRVEIGDRRGIAYMSNCVAKAEIRLGQYEAAARRLEESLQTLKALKDKQLVAQAMFHQSEIILERV